MPPAPRAPEDRSDNQGRREIWPPTPLARQQQANSRNDNHEEQPLIDAFVLPALLSVADPRNELVCFDVVTPEFGEVSAFGKLWGDRR